MKYDEFYVDKNNQFFIRMKNILDYRRQNVLKPIQSSKHRPLNYIKCQKHHIIPRCWYRHNGYTIDNSDYNIIFLTPGEHLEIHVLMREYFRSVNDIDMYYAMAFAIDKMTNGNVEWIKKIVNDDDEKTFYLNQYEQNLEIVSQAISYRYKKMSPEQRQLISKHISDGWNNMDQTKYDNLCKKRSEFGKKMWEDETYKIGSDEWKQHQSESQKRAWANKTDAQKEVERQKRIEIWKNKPNEEKQRLKNQQHDIQTNIWKNKSDEDKIIHGKKISNSYKNKTPEQRQLQKKRQSNARKQYLASLTPEEKEKISQERKSRRWISNDELMISKMVHINEIPEMLNQGWILGCKSVKYKKLKALIQLNT